MMSVHGALSSWVTVCVVGLKVKLDSKPWLLLTYWERLRISEVIMIEWVTTEIVIGFPALIFPATSASYWEILSMCRQQNSSV